MSSSGGEIQILRRRIFASRVRYSACAVSLIVAEAGSKMRFATTKSFVGSVNYKLDNGGSAPSSASTS